jgi:transcriptional regulator GlxA family with amidase domain
MTGDVHVAILLFEGVEELDWAGPWEVLTMWAALAGRAGGRAVTVELCGDRRGPITCAKGARVLADRTWDELATTPDVVVVPGGRGTRGLVEDPDLLALLRRLHADGALLASVCTGSLLLAAAGLLEHRPATTHHGALHELQGLDGSCEVRPDQRWVDDGDVVTAAGVSAGIDMALHLVDRLAGTERARAVRRAIQYDPAPPV